MCVLGIVFCSCAICLYANVCACAVVSGEGYTLGANRLIEKMTELFAPRLLGTPKLLLRICILIDEITLRFLA